jgi:preprotein translocase subunit SecG
LTGGIKMDIVLIIVSVLLITVVLLQSDKSESASNILLGASSELFANRKERGFELFISRFTLILGILFFVICVIMALL